MKNVAILGAFGALIITALLLTNNPLGLKGETNLMLTAILVAHPPEYTGPNPPPPDPTPLNTTTGVVDLKANGSDGPIDVPVGTQVMFSWTMNRSDFACTIDGTAAVNGPANAEVPWVLPTGSRTVTIVCINPGGAGGGVDMKATDSVIVNVLGPTPTPLSIGEGGPIFIGNPQGGSVVKIISPADNSPAGPIKIIMRGHGGYQGFADGKKYVKWNSALFILDGTSIGPGEGSTYTGNAGLYHCDENGNDTHNTEYYSTEFWCSSRTIDLTDLPEGKHTITARGFGYLNAYTDDTITLIKSPPAQASPASPAATTVTKANILKILNDALADGVIDAAEKRALLSALNTYLSEGTPASTVTTPTAPVNRDTATESFRQSCNVQDTSGYAGLIGSCKTQKGHWVFAKYRRVGCSEDLANVNGTITCQSVSATGGGGGGGTTGSGLGTLNVSVSGAGNIYLYSQVRGYMGRLGTSQRVIQLRAPETYWVYATSLSTGERCYTSSHINLREGDQAQVKVSGVCY